MFGIGYNIYNMDGNYIDDLVKVDEIAAHTSSTGLVVVPLNRFEF